LKRIEPNLLLAVATAIPLILLIATATLFGAPGQLVKYLVIAVIVPVAFVPMNAVMRRKRGWIRPPMIHPQGASTADHSGGGRPAGLPRPRLRPADHHRRHLLRPDGGVGDQGGAGGLGPPLTGLS